MPATGPSNPPTCPYCPGNPPAALRDAGHVYGPTYDGRFNLWVCVNYKDCDTYVGVHRDSPSAAPVGTMANEKLRKLRIKVHSAFDELWKSKQMKRNAAYRHLEKIMGMPVGKCHIGWFDEDECHKALMLLTESPNIRESQ